MEGEFDGLFHLNFPRIAHRLHLLFVCWIFSNDKWSDVKLSVTYHPSSVRRQGLCCCFTDGCFAAMGKVM